MRFSVFLSLVLALTIHCAAQAQCDPAQQPPFVTTAPAGGSVSRLWDAPTCGWLIGVGPPIEPNSTQITIRPAFNGQRITSINVQNATNRNPVWLFVARSEDGTKTFERVGAIPWHINNTGPVFLAELRTSGNVGAIEVNHMNVVDGVEVGGNVTGQITMKQYPPLSTQTEPQLLRMLIRGSLLAHIDQPTSSQWGYTIKLLEVLGDIGTPMASRNVWPLGNIERITVPNGSIYANIDPTKYGALRAIGRVDCNGSLNGILKTRKFDPALAAPSGLPSGIVTTVGDVTGQISTTLAMDQTIRIGGSLTSTARITMPGGGLVGQIIINGTDTTGVWHEDAFISTGTINLSPMPYYDNDPEIGGYGAAGLARFRLQDNACVPVNNTSFVVRHRDLTWTGEGDPTCVDEDFNAGNVVTLRLYGNVTLVGAAPHFGVYRFDGVNENLVSWSAGVVTAYVPGATHKDITVKRGAGVAWGIGSFVIRPLAGKVTSDDVAGNPLPDVLYTIALTDTCQEGYEGAFDQNGDSRLSNADTARWLANPCDLNNDGVAGAADLALLIRVIERFGN